MADETPEQSYFGEWLSVARNSGCAFAALVAGSASRHLFYDVLEFSPEAKPVPGMVGVGDSPPVKPDAYDATMMMTKKRSQFIRGVDGATKSQLRQLAFRVHASCRDLLTG